ncbi:MAG: hypothetical protein LHW44_01550 [Candidatus Cloacimonetes bacterium]|nr:hypothetical protein [Candidatus Cloacimonadota bacterium]
MKSVSCDGYDFDFPKALNAFKFDSTDKNDQYYHGAPMKAVDIIVEFENEYVFIEIKNFHNRSRYEDETALEPFDIQDNKGALNLLKESLKYKYRDSLLYRFAESKVDNPIHYICLLNLKPSTLYGLAKVLRKELPVGISCARWKKPLAESCVVLNEAMFQSQFPKWRISTEGFTALGS